MCEEMGYTLGNLGQYTQASAVSCAMPSLLELSHYNAVVANLPYQGGQASHFHQLLLFYPRLVPYLPLWFDFVSLCFKIF